MMNKKEKAEFDALKLEISIAKAMCFKEYAPNKIDTQEATNKSGFSTLVVAWRPNVYNGTVSQGCFNSVNHSPTSTEKTSTQGRGGPWYETEREAWMAVRMVKQREYAEDLARIDRQIEEAA